ncbi:MAG: SdrD B-like domain-containing protein, partial [Dolichospermum sp.]
VVTVNPQATVGNYVWVDANQNGLQDDGSANGINGVTVELWNATTNTLVATTTTANDGSSNPGYYQFKTCTAGDYFVKFPTTNGGFGLTSQTPTAATDNNSDAAIADGKSPVFTLNPAGTSIQQNNQTIDAGYLPCVAPTTTSATTVCATNCMNLTGTAPTTGTWTANAGNPAGATLGATAAGVAQVCFSAAASGNYVFTYTVAGGCTGSTTVTVNPQATVGNYVWVDANQNGLQDEPVTSGVNGVTVELWDATSNTLVASTITANNGGNPGYYEFKTCTAGNYYVKFPTTYNSNPLTTQNPTAATDNNSDASTTTGQSPVFTLDPAGTAIQKTNNTIDAGYLPCVAPTVTSATTVCATNCMNLTGTAPTTGTWTASGSNPAGATLGTTTAGVANVCFSAAASGTYTFTYTVAGGCTGTTVVTVNPQATVGNYVWSDVNNNGLQDEPASSGINGLTVELYNATTNTLVATTTTANDGSGNPGYYQFKTCTAGDYYVKFATTNATGNGLTSQTTTAAIDGNSDANTTTGQSPVFTLNPAGTAIQKTNNTIDAGYVVCTKPTVDAGAGAGVPLTICAGNCASLTGTNALFQGTFTAMGTNPAGATLGVTTVVTNTPNKVSNAQVCFATIASGIYKFIYTVNGGCADTLTINVTPKPNAGSDNSICQGRTTTMTASGVGTWTQLPSNPAVVTFSSNTNPTATVGSFNTAGNYNFVWTNNGCSDTVLINVRPTSSSLTTRYVCISTLPFIWNGNTYNASTTDTVILTNSVGCDSLAILRLVVQTPNCYLQASYTINQNAQCVQGNAFSFTSTVTGNTGVLSYLWNFGDGTTSTAANPTHTYATAGEYDVTLIVTESNACIGSCTAYASTKQLYVGPKPSVNFDWQYNGNCLTYDFNSTSTVSMGW